MPFMVLATSLESPDITVSDRLYADALERRCYRVAGVPWDVPREAFAGADAVVLRSTRGYYRTLEAFRDWTEASRRSPDRSPVFPTRPAPRAWWCRNSCPRSPRVSCR